MKRTLISAALLIIVVVALAAPVAGEVPGVINYQGRLTDQDGSPLDTVVQMQFAIYGDSVEVSPVWTETHAPVTVVDGLFSVLLGSVNPLTEILFWDDVISNAYLGITVGSDAELSPRTRVSSVPYALRSAGDDWEVVDSVLRTYHYWGIARGGADNMLWGDNSHTMVNLGVSCTTGTSGERFSCATVGGGYANTAAGEMATASGGYANSAHGDWSTVGGGNSNTAYGEKTTVGGGFINYAWGDWSVIAGGYNNYTSNVYTTVAGGNGNHAGGERSAVGGGYLNTASGTRGFVGGGYYNTADGAYSTVSGGYWDTAGADYATISGGYWNSAWGEASTIAGGSGNTASGDYSTVSGGEKHIVSGDYSVIPGGYADTIAESADYSYLFGIGSSLTGDSTFMVDMPHIRFGDETNGYEFPTTDGAADQVMATDGSGQLTWGYGGDSRWSLYGSVLQTNDFWGLARGEAGNVLYGDSSHTMVNFGVACTTGVSGEHAAYVSVSGGKLNRVDSIGGTVGGGMRNRARGRYSVVAGGRYDTASGEWSTVGGGNANTAKGGWSTVAGGISNKTVYDYATVGGGNGNEAFGAYATVPGGWNNYAKGNYSFTAGRRARALHAGTFVWADSIDADFESTGVNQFLIRATGGVSIDTTASEAKLTIKAGSNGKVLKAYNQSGDVVLEIGEGLDYSEAFPTAQPETSPGMVLSIDPEHSGFLMPSRTAYDRKVAGIVAGARGLSSGVRLGSEVVGADDPAVALAGRVYCNVDTRYGDIQPGDLLTTSPTVGHAMVVDDYSRAQGAILGKAMEGLSGGSRGQILVLVTLQ